MSTENLQKREVGRPWAFPLTKEWGVQFIRDWINGVIEGTTEIKDDETRQRFFWYTSSGCGRSWVPHLTEEHGYSGKEGDLDSLVAACDAHFKERSGPEAEASCVRQGNVITTKMGVLKKEFYPRYPAVEETIRKFGRSCCCALIINGIIPLGPEICNCSRQMFNYTYERASGKRCTTEIIQAIGRGDENCVMRTTISDKPLDEKKKGYIEKTKKKA